MLRLRRVLMLLAVTAGLGMAQPALTTIQDILYRADGTRYAGTMFIKWKSFQAGDTSNIATADLTLQIVNGVLSVKLVPTTTGTPGAHYEITYNSQGKNQFSETWAVPPSSLALRVRDVRTSSGTVVGPPPVSAPVQIADVVGLGNALNVRPTQGVGFSIGRAAIINSAGQIDGAAGNLGDCVRVDGSSGPCGGGGGGVTPLFVDGESPTGAVNGVNSVFLLNRAASPAASLNLYRNGLLQRPGTDFSLAGAVITFFSGALPRSGDLLTASYRYADPGNPLGSLGSPQVVCSTNGTSTSGATFTPLGTCTVPAGLLGTGDRLEVQFHYAHTGTSTGFVPEIRWGATTLISRTAGSTDTAFSGRITLGIYAGGQSWDSQSWGSTLAAAFSSGNAAENSSLNQTISLQGRMSTATADALILRNFTVVRYPAQSNP